MQFRKRARSLPFGRANWVLFGAGILIIIVGYRLLAIPPAEGFWSLTAAPIVLVAGYCVLIPIALLRRPKRTAENGQQVEQEPGRKPGSKASKGG